MVNSNPQSENHHHEGSHVCLFDRRDLQLAFEMVHRDNVLNLSPDQQNHMLDILFDHVRAIPLLNDRNRSYFHRFDALRYIVWVLFEPYLNRPDA